MNARNPVIDAMENQEQAPPICLDTLFTTCEQLQQAGQYQQALDLNKSWLAKLRDSNRHMAWLKHWLLQQSFATPDAAVEIYKNCLTLHTAPMRGTYLGFIGATVNPWFDFVIADHNILPEELALHFTEQELYVVCGFIQLTNETNNSNYIKSKAYESNRFPVNTLIMTAFRDAYKITADRIEAWIKILKNKMSTLLLLIDDNDATTNNIKEYASKNKIAQGQIIFTKSSPDKECRKKLNLADVLLDNYFYNYGSTIQDVLSKGLSLTKISGKSMVSKGGKSISKSIELKELAANNVENHIKKISFNGEDRIALQKTKKLEWAKYVGHAKK